MNPNTIIKFANKILNCDDPLEAIAISNYQFQYFDGEIDFINYFSAISKSNFIIATLIYFNYQNLHNVDMPQVIDILVGSIRSHVENLQGESIDLKPSLNMNNTQIEKALVDINQIADLCIADIMVNTDSSLHDVVFNNTVMRIKRREDCYGLFLNRCGELLSYLDNQNRCIYTIRLITKLIIYCNDKDNRVLALILKSLSNRPLHFYGEISTQITNCILKLYALNDPFVLQQTLELFPQTSFSTLSTNLYDFLGCAQKYNNHKDYEKRIIKLIACAEMLNSRENKSLSDLVFKDVVFEQFEETFKNNPALKETVNLRFVCKSIADDPKNMEDFLIDISGATNSFNHAIADVVKDAFNALVRDNPTKVTTFINWLNTANVYRLNLNVKNSGINYNNRIPGIKNYTDFCNTQFQHLSSYCAIEDLVYIYFNSHIRVYLPIEELMRIIYEKSPKKRDDYMMVKNTFGKYIINGVLKYDDSGEPHFTTEQFRTNLPYLSVSGYARITQEYLEKIKSTSGGTISFIIESFNITAGFNPQIALLDNENKSKLMKDTRETIEFLSRYLEQIADRKCYTDTDISILGEIPQKLKKNSDLVLFGMKLIHCCYSFNDNLTSVNFLKQVFGNPYRIRSYYYPVPIGIGIGENNFQFCLNYVRQMLDGNGALEEWLYLYFNTILRSVYYFDSFLNRLSFNSKDLDLWILYDVYGTKLHGRIISINEKTTSIFPLSFKLSNEWHVICTTPAELCDYSENDSITFDLYGVDFDNRTIYVENASKTSVRNTYFCTGMNKAKLTLELDRYDIRNLLQTPSVLKKSEIKKLALDELEAIKLRVGNSISLTEFLSVIEKSNPWSFSENLLPCILSINDSNGFLVESTINDLVDSNSLDSAVSVYFNTSLKSAYTVDRFVRILIAKYKDTNRIYDVISPYKIRVLGYNNNTDTSSNVYLDPRHYLKLKTGKYIYAGYDKDSHLIKLKSIL